MVVPGGLSPGMGSTWAVSRPGRPRMAVKHSVMASASASMWSPALSRSLVRSCTSDDRADGSKSLMVSPPGIVNGRKCYIITLLGGNVGAECRQPHVGHHLEHLG